MSSDGAAAAPDATWTPTPEAKKQATTFRLIAAGLWVVAIALELFTIFWLLARPPVNTVLLIVLIVVIGILAVGGSLLWRRANRLDPASEKDKVRFFIQNQLGAIITIIAFLPLIIMVFTSKNLDGRQKALAGTIGIVVAVVAVFFGISFDSPSVEQYSHESNIIQKLTGNDLVYWTKSGSVFHVCSAVPDVNKESKDGQIYEGAVADAHAAGKQRLTLKWESEAVTYCGYTQDQVDAVASETNDSTTAPEPAPTN